MTTDYTGSEGFLDLGNLEDIPDLVTLPGTAQYELECINVGDSRTGELIATGTTEDGRPWARVDLQYKVLNPPEGLEGEVKDVYHSIWLPVDEDTERQRASKLRMMKAAKQAHGLPLSGPFSVRDFEGTRCSAIITERERPGGVTRNEIKKYVTTR